MGPERRLEARCCAYAKGRGCWALKLWPSVAGLPDRLVLTPGGRVRFVEFKTPGGRTSPIQRRVFALLDKMGFHVRVIDNFDGFKAMLDGVLP